MADPVHAYDPLRVDEHVAPALIGVRLMQARPAAPGHRLGVGPPGAWAPYVPQPGVVHAVRVVLRAILVDQDRPPHALVGRVLLRDAASLERHDDDVDGALGQVAVMLTQLRQVVTARQSAQVTMEHQQEPSTSEVLKAQACAAVIEEVET